MAPTHTIADTPKASQQDFYRPAPPSSIGAVANSLMENAMRSIAVVLVAAACLAGCQKSASAQYEEMYEYQKKYDPEKAKVTEESYKYKDYMSDQSKMEMVEVYNQLLDQREVVNELKKKAEEGE